MGCWRSTTYMISWNLVEPHEPQRVLRQFGLAQHIPTLEQTGFTEWHIKLTRRGKARVDWSVQHARYIASWEARHQMVHDVVVDYSGTMLHDYMRWYRGMTVTYISQPGIHAPEGFHESASSLEYAVETISQMAQKARLSEFAHHPAIAEVIQMGEDALRRLGQNLHIEVPPSQRTQVDLSQPFVERSRRIGKRGVRTGGHGMSRDSVSQQSQFQPDQSHLIGPSSQYQTEQSEQRWSPWLYEQQPDSLPEDHWQTHRGSVDSYFAGVSFEPAVQDTHDEDDDPTIPETQDVHAPDPEPTPAPSGRSGIARSIVNVFSRRSKRDGKGKAPSKYTPSSYK